MNWANFQAAVELLVTEGPGKRVEVVGSLGMQPVRTKDEDTPYAS